MFRQLTASAPKSSLALTLLGAVGALVCAANGGGDVNPARASHAGGAQSFAIDMNPFAPVPNTASSLSDRQTCARIEVNGVQDADEDGVDLVLLDVTASQFPNQVLGFEYWLSYGESALTIQSHDQNFFLAAAGGSSLFDASEAIPDVDANNQWTGAAMDTAENTHETGSGVLHRVTMAADSGAASGVYAINFMAGMSGHADTNNDGYMPDNLYGATIVMGTSYCPRTDSDSDGVFDQDEYACAGAAAVYNNAIRPERIDGVFAGVSDDGDSEIDELLPAGSGGYDCDGDGYKGDAVTTNSQSSSEKFVYGTADTRPDQDPCGWRLLTPPYNVPIGWPADLRGDSSFSANKVNVQDLATFTTPVSRMNTSPGDANYDARWDIVPGKSGLAKDINVVDQANLTNLFPAMLGGSTEAFNGPLCPWPP